MGLPRLSVLGTGYLGATHATCLASLGFEVLGFDVDDVKVKTLAGGDVPFYEPGLADLLRRSLDTGRLRFTSKPDDLAGAADVHFLCVGTPQRRDSYGADLSYLEDAVGLLLPQLRPGDLVVGKSTVPVGTAARLAERLPAGVDLAWNPEFLREGHAVEDTLRPDRLVFGVRAPAAEERLRAVYAAAIGAGTPVVVSDFATAELVKAAANAFLATKISFINAMAEICEAAHADVTKLAESLAHDSRIGGQFLRPGLGFGGGCLPKDIRAFMARADELGVDQALSFLADVDMINERRRSRTVELAVELLDERARGARVAVLGAAFKPESDDIRDSPALDVAARLARLGATVLVYDPAAMENARRAYPQLTYADSVIDACASADLVLHLTEWSEFGELDPRELGDRVAGRRVLDGRNALDAERWRAAGWVYRSLGRP